jgi:hypothetical protein
MKEAFWKVDDSSGFRFSDATDPNQLLLFDINELPTLINKLNQNFSGKNIPVKEIREFVENKTLFLPSHMRSALKDLELHDLIIVEEIKLDGSKRRRGTFPDNVIVNFPA